MPTTKKKSASEKPSKGKQRRAEHQDRDKRPTEDPKPAPPDPQPDESALNEENTPAFPVVAIGATAGGLEALETTFANLHAKTGMAFVIITHTDPKHASLLPDIIQRKTHRKVSQIEDGMPIEPDHVYLPPSDRDPVVSKDDRFKLIPRPAQREIHMPIDLFMKHLAHERGVSAAGVILSGTVTDGTHGVLSIKENAGLAIAQDPKTARHTGMPASAIETGLVDLVLAPSDIRKWLKKRTTNFTSD